MNSKYLKIIRVIVAAVVFILILLSFLNFSATNYGTQCILKTQFIPSLLALFTGAAVPFVALLLLTLIFGRVYCSFLCPTGILQDIIIRLSDYSYKLFHKGKKRLRNKGYKKPHNKLRYLILIIIGALFALGLTLPLTLLDPYSAFGKISVQIIGNLEIFITNILAGIFPSTIPYQEYFRFSLFACLYSSIFLLVLIVFSGFKGRLYCNSICPVGTLLGFIGGKSLFRPVIDKSKCIQCNACSLRCKSNCINVKEKEIDSSRCVVCFNCIGACSQSGIKYKPLWFTCSTSITAKNSDTTSEQLNSTKNRDSTTSASTESKKHEQIKSQNHEIEKKSCQDPGRRNTLIAFGALGTALIAHKALGETLVPKTENVPLSRLGITPPGAISINHLKQNCTACYACVAACPNGIIHPATFEYGTDGIMLPTIKYDHKFCGYECNKCTQVCPNGALQPLTIEKKKLTQIGRAVYFPKRCVVFTDGTDCGACDEHCPTKAIIMVPVAGADFLYHPKLNKELCIGCGGCEYICPQTPKAIKVVSLPVQGLATKPSDDKQEEKKVEDFGF